MRPPRVPRGSTVKRLAVPKSPQLLPGGPSLPNFTLKHIIKDQRRKDKINYNAPLFPDDEPNKAQLAFPTVTANTLEPNEKPPRGVKMLARDFIEDSLYNPNYGYFPKQATIVRSGSEGFNFQAMINAGEFDGHVADRYASYGSDNPEGPGKQLWHTPTELFKPWYGQAIAQCLVSEYLLKYFPYEDFIIYEIGAGNGTLAENILDYIQDQYPDVYERTRYNIIEISGNLAELQKEKLVNHPCVNISHKSIFHWKGHEPAPCFFVAMEVIDNFAHDLVRYDIRTSQPYQGTVVIDEEGDFSTYYTPVTDPLISSFLAVRDQLRHETPLPRLLSASPILRKVYSALPFAPNLSKPEYLPTRMFSMLQTLRDHFPRHRLLLSDFSSLPDAIKGVNGPVVQTRFRNITVPVTTFLVAQGYFDIFFPTNFEKLRDMYEHILSTPLSSVDTRASPLASSRFPTSLGAEFFSSHVPTNRRLPSDGATSASGLPVGEHKSSVFTHAEFLETYADLEKTTVRSGENPMLDFYKNVKFLF